MMSMQSEASSNVQDHSRGDHFPWIIEMTIVPPVAGQVRFSGYLAGMHPDGRKTPRKWFRGVEQYRAVHADLEHVLERYAAFDG